ncbi:MAG: HdeD family acid-resistance protein [Gemmatimonadota bacterium]
MLALLAENWWAFVLRGIFAVLFGIAAVSFPGLTVVILVVLFGFYALVDGFTSLLLAFEAESKGLYVLGGLVSLAAGVLAFMRPELTAIAVLIVIGIWAIVRGVIEIVTAIQIRKEVEGEWMLAAAGIISVIFGLFVVARPGQGALAIIWVVALFALMFGFLEIGAGFKLRRLRKAGEAVVESVAQAASAEYGSAGGDQ